jgi:hypothetical protein
MKVGVEIVDAIEWLEVLELSTVVMDMAAYDDHTFNPATDEGFDFQESYSRVIMTWLRACLRLRLRARLLV